MSRLTNSPKFAASTNHRIGGMWSAGDAAPWSKVKPFQGPNAMNTITGLKREMSNVIQAKQEEALGQPTSSANATAPSSAQTPAPGGAKAAPASKPDPLAQAKTHNDETEKKHYAKILQKGHDDALKRMEALGFSMADRANKLFSNVVKKQSSTSDMSTLGFSAHRKSANMFVDLLTSGPRNMVDGVGRALYAGTQGRGAKEVMKGVGQAGMGAVETGITATGVGSLARAGITGARSAARYAGNTARRATGRTPRQYASGNSGRTATQRVDNRDNRVANMGDRFFGRSINRRWDPYRRGMFSPESVATSGAFAFAPRGDALFHNSNRGVDEHGNPGWHSQHSWDAYDRAMGG